MSSLLEQNVWHDGIYQLEEDDYVRGGSLPEGVSNRQAKELADRTLFLKQGIEDLVEQFSEGQRRIVSEYRYFASELSEWELAKNRLLRLVYQIIKISDYQELCDRMYCGDAANATAYFWYKCSSGGARSTSGQYMRVADWRGMFMRGAGANAVFKAANDTPYDGKSIGYFLGDAVRNAQGIIYAFVTGGVYSHGIDPNNVNGVFETAVISSMVEQSHVEETIRGATRGAKFNLSNVVPTATENRPASTSALFCITY